MPLPSVPLLPMLSSTRGAAGRQGRLILCKAADGCLDVMKVVLQAAFVSPRSPGLVRRQRLRATVSASSMGCQDRRAEACELGYWLHRSMKDTGNPDHDDFARKALSSSTRTRQSVTPKMCKHTGLLVKGVSGRPIAGWPATKVRFMAQNKICGLGSAQPMNEFPIPLMVIGLGSAYQHNSKIKDRP